MLAPLLFPYLLFDLSIPENAPDRPAEEIVV
jgi:hypothetical protein